MVYEHESEYGLRWATTVSVSGKIGERIKKSEVDSGQCAGVRHKPGHFDGLIDGLF